MRSTVALANISARHSQREIEEASDEALVCQIAKGNKHAMRVLWARHNVKVYRFILRLSDDATVAEDVVSEVFLDVWRQANSFKAKSQVSTWLLAIARYKALSMLRRRVDLELDEADAVQDAADDPECAVQAADRGRIVQHCLRRLSASHREVIDLVYYQERSIAEVASVIGISANTVKTRMFYARNRLSELLRQAGVRGM